MRRSYNVPCQLQLRDTLQPSIAIFLEQPVFHKLSGLETEKPASPLATTSSESEKPTASTSSLLSSLALLLPAQSTQDAS